MPTSGRETTTHALGALRLLGGLGLTVAAGTIAGLGLGVWLGGWIERGWPVAVGALLGVAAGGAGALALLLRELPWKR